MVFLNVFFRNVQVSIAEKIGLTGLNDRIVPRDVNVVIVVVDTYDVPSMISAVPLSADIQSLDPDLCQQDLERLCIALTL